jgi:hypothetical protein
MFCRSTITSQLRFEGGLVKNTGVGALFGLDEVPQDHPKVLGNSQQEYNKIFAVYVKITSRL